MLTALLVLQAVSSAAPRPIPIDRPSWIVPTDYPRQALINGEEGTVEFEVMVDPIGRPGECRIVTSSGHAGLDETTCKLVQSRARFGPAIGAEGKAVASSYRSTITWHSGGSARVWHATIVDFGADRRHPTCTEQQSSPSVVGDRSCAEILQNSQRLQELGRKFTRVVFLFATADGTQTAYEGDPSWGKRLSFLASEQYYLEGSFPTACKTVAAEGESAGSDACAGFPNGRQLTDEEIKRAGRTRVEMSTFGVRWAGE